MGNATRGTLKAHQLGTGDAFLFYGYDDTPTRLADQVTITRQGSVYVLTCAEGRFAGQEVARLGGAKKIWAEKLPVAAEGQPNESAVITATEEVEAVEVPDGYDCHTPDKATRATMKGHALFQSARFVWYGKGSQPTAEGVVAYIRRSTSAALHVFANADDQHIASVDPKTKFWALKRRELTLAERAEVGNVLLEPAENTVTDEPTAVAPELTAAPAIPYEPTGPTTHYLPVNSDRFECGLAADLGTAADYAPDATCGHCLIFMDAEARPDEHASPLLRSTPTRGNISRLARWYGAQIKGSTTTEVGLGFENVTKAAAFHGIMAEHDWTMRIVDAVPDFTSGVTVSVEIEPEDGEPLATHTGASGTLVTLSRLDTGAYRLFAQLGGVVTVDTILDRGTFTAGDADIFYVNEVRKAERANALDDLANVGRLMFQGYDTSGRLHTIRAIDVYHGDKRRAAYRVFVDGRKGLTCTNAATAYAALIKAGVPIDETSGDASANS